MATEKEQVVLEFKVEQGDAINELERTRLSIIKLKEQQQELAKAYKTGNITQKEYAQELVRVESLLKRESTAYNSLTKSVTGVQTQTDKLIGSNKKLAQSLQDTLGKVNVMGVNVGSLGGVLKGLMSPVGLAAGAVGLLGAAYARSSVGAKDLEFASNQLGAAVSILTDRFALLFSKAEDGEGAVTRILNSIGRTTTRSGREVNTALGDFISSITEDVGDISLDELQKQSKELAMIVEELEDLSREELKIRGQISGRLEENSELMTEISSEATTLQQKLANVATIGGNLRENQAALLDILNRQLEKLEAQRKENVDNGKLEDAIAQKKAEIEASQTRTTKLIERNNKLEDDLIEKEEKRLKLLAEQTSELERQARIVQRQRDIENGQANFGGDPLNNVIQFFQNRYGDPATEKALNNLREISDVESEVNRKAIMGAQDVYATKKILDDRIAAIQEGQKKRGEGLMMAQDAERDALRLFSSEAGRLYQSISDDQQGFAAAQLAMDAGLTLSALTRVAATLGPFAGPIYFAAGLASALANLTRAAKLIGTNIGVLGVAPTTFTDANGQQYEIIEGEAVAIKPEAKTGIGRVLQRNFRSLRRLNRKIQKALGFAEGGYTGDGGVLEPAGTVHRGEYVAPQHVVNNPSAAPHIVALESMRQRGYADGGLVRPALGSEMNQNIVAALQQATFVVGLTETTKSMNRQKRKMTYVTR